MSVLRRDDGTDVTEAELLDALYRGSLWPYKCPQLVYGAGEEHDKVRRRKAQWDRRRGGRDVYRPLGEGRKPWRRSWGGLW